MSWYIQYLLRHREEIRANMYSNPATLEANRNYQDEASFDDDEKWFTDGGYSALIVIEPNFESDAFNDLLILEKKLVELYKEGIISKDDIKLVELIGMGLYYSDLEKELGKDRLTISKTFNNLCILLSYKLGSIFSDEEMCKRLQEDYNLTDEQVGKIKLYMKSNLKNKKVKGRSNK